MSSLNNPFLIKSYSDESGNWYRVYSDGWCEQGGLSDRSNIINLLMPMLNSNYNAIITISNASTPSDVRAVNPKDKTVSSFTIVGGAIGIYWKVCGYVNLNRVL